MAKKDTALAGISYLLLFLSLLGLIIDVIIYYSTKNKYAKFHAGQACFLALVMTVIGLFLITPISILVTNVMHYLNPGLIGTGWDIAGWSIIVIYSYIIISAIIYIVQAMWAFSGKDFRIPIAARLLEKYSERHNYLEQVVH